MASEPKAKNDSRFRHKKKLHPCYCKKRMPLFFTNLSITLSKVWWFFVIMYSLCVLVLHLYSISIIYINFLVKPLEFLWIFTCWGSLNFAESPTGPLKEQFQIHLPIWSKSCKLYETRKFFWIIRTLPKWYLGLNNLNLFFGLVWTFYS